MAYVMIWDPFERLMYGICIAVFFMTGILFLTKGKQQQESEGNKLMYAFAFFFIFFAIRSIFIFLSEFQYRGYIQEGVFYGEYDHYYPIYEIYVSLAHAFITLSFLSLLLGFEIYLKKTKYALTIMLALILVFLIVLPFEAEVLVISFVPGVVTIFFTIFVFYFIKNSPPELKSIACFLYSSFILIVLGILFTYPLTKSSISFPIYLGPVVFIISCLIIMVPLIINPDKLTKSMNYYITSIVVSVFVVCFSLPIILFMELPLFIKIFDVIIVILVGLFILHSYPIMKSQVKSSVEDEQILSVFIRPRKVTEEEVSVSKDKKICLVCKGKVGRVMYMCPECNALYCIKCFTALSNLENACWVCNTPLDESMPSKPFEKEKKEKIEVEEKMKGKGE
jgi:hypothetical protein